MNVPIEGLAAARESILARIADAARASGREPSEVTLTAACKQQPWLAIDRLLAAGQTVFGENRLQEATARWRDRPATVELRYIGALQSNKAREAVALFDAIETVDRAGLAKPLADAIQRLGRAPRLSVQVNTGEEPQKSGVAPRDVARFITQCHGEFGLRIEGLMCIPPVGEPPAPHFALLAKIAADNGLRRLSMGMSDDFEAAIRLGATSVRIGAALFGARPAPRQ